MEPAPDAEAAPVPPTASELERLLGAATDAIAAGDLESALRSADRARRLAPRSAEIATLLGRILLRLGKPGEAVVHLERASRELDDVKLECALIDALAAVDRREEAYERLGRALQAFATSPGDDLALAARRHVFAPGSPAAGWVGVRPDLTLWGEFAPSDEAILLAGPDDTAFTMSIEMSETDPPRSMFAAALAPTYHGPLLLTREDAPLLGGDMPFPPDFRLDGRCRAEDGEVSGWFRIGWGPALAPDVVARDEFRSIARIRPQPDMKPDGRFEFRAGLGALTTQGSRLRVAVEMPDGRLEELPDSPAFVRLPPAPRGRPRRSIRRRSHDEAEGRSIDVIVPVYIGRVETWTCLRSVLDAGGPAAELIVVDDASPDRELAADLEAMAARGEITLLQNKLNRGFPASVNRALKLHPSRDAVILNADAEVFPGWLERLRAAAYSAPDIGTATPFTNAGAIASYPAGGEAACDSSEAAEIQRLAAEVDDGVRVEVPTGVGFCMYIRRDCLTETGLLDSQLFARGYGEENDFCMRARALGWRHVLAADVFVRHLGAHSFGAARRALMERNGRLVALRHPEHDALVNAFLDADPVHPARRRLDEARLAGIPGDFVLLVSMAPIGGVDRFVLSRCQALREQGCTPLVLRPADRLDAVRLSMDGIELSDLVYDLEGETPLLLDLLRRVGPKWIELHHFLGHDADLVEKLLTLGPPYRVYVHDYGWICPRLTLLGGAGEYCGEPAAIECDACISTHGSSLPDLSARELRLRSHHWLGGADQVLVATHDVAERLRRYFPEAPIAIEPWEADRPARAATPHRLKKAVKVVIVGAIGVQKGYDVLLACAKDAAARDLPLDFVVIGYTKGDLVLMDTGKVFVTGQYEEDEVDALIEREQPNVALYPSVTPETWCFSLTHAMRHGLPVVAFDLGAVAERLRASSVDSELIPLGSDAEAINNCLLRLALRNQEASGGTMAAWRRCLLIDADPGIEPADDVLSLDASGSEPDGGADEGPMPDASSGLTATVQLMPLNKGVYTFSVQSATPNRMGDDGDVVLPAIQVAVAPGISTDNVEFMTGLRTEGAWLFDQRDMLIVKVKVHATPMLVTSFSMAGLTPLALHVERIDQRRPAAAAQPRIAAPVQPALPSAPPLPERQPARPEPALARLAEFRAAAADASTAAAPPPLDDAIGGSGPLASNGRKPLRTEIVAHISYRGDVSFVDTVWAGAMGEKLPMEAFTITPLEGLSAGDIEYKGLTATGVETPWIGGGAPCGTRRQRTPLTGFAVRLKGDRANRYDCEYRGSFGSGAIVGPLRNGAPLRSSNPEDYLQAIQVLFTEVPQPAEEVESGPPPVRPVAVETTAARSSRTIGPRFSVFREGVE